MAKDQTTRPTEDNGNDLSIENFLKSLGSDEEEDKDSTQTPGGSLTISEDDEDFPEEMRGKTLTLADAKKMMKSYSSAQGELTKAKQTLSEMAKKIEGKTKEETPRNLSKPSGLDYLADTRLELRVAKIDDPIKKQFFENHSKDLKAFLANIPVEDRASDNAITAAMNYVAGENVDELQKLWTEGLQKTEEETSVETPRKSPTVVSKAKATPESVRNVSRTPSYLKDMDDARKSNLTAWAEGDADTIKKLIGEE